MMPALTPGNLLAYAVQVAVIVSIGGALPFVLRVRAPRARLVYWRGLLLACLALPFLQPRPAPAPVQSQGMAAIQQGENIVVMPGEQGPAAPEASSTEKEKRWRVRRLVAATLVAGGVARVAWLGLGMLTLARLRRRAPLLLPRPTPVQEACEVVGADAEFRAAPGFLRPVTFGARMPVVLLPGRFESLEPGQQKAIACHELLHVKRHDWVRTTFDEVVRAGAWFHPAIWWLLDQIHLSREQVVDRKVVSLLGARQAYLEALLRLAAPGGWRETLRPASPFLKQAHLKPRIALLVKESRMSKTRLLAALFIMAALVLGGGNLIVRAIPLELIAPAPEVQELQLRSGHEAVTMAFDRARLGDLLQFVGKATGVDISFSSDVPEAAKAAAVSVNLENVGVEAALRAILRTQNLTYEVAAERAILVVPAEGAADARSRAAAREREWQAADAARAASQAQSAAGQRGAGGVGGGVAGGVGGGVAGGVTAGGVVGGVASGVAGGQRAASKRPAAPVARNRVDPVPGSVNGMGIARATVELSGQVVDAVYAAGNPALEPIVLDAVRQWIFEPLAEPATTFIGFNVTPETTDPIVEQPLTIGGKITPPKKVFDVKPAYPAAARTAGIQGVQIFELLVDDGGAVRNARTLRTTDETLAVEAMFAVLQWKFTPVLLNGEPRPFVMTVTVNFSLGGEPKAPAGFSAGGTPLGAGADPATWPAGAMRVGGNIKPPMKIKDVKPVYPPVAFAARVQGVVICEVLIGPDGKVQDAKVLRSIPLLDQAALEAVQQWEFTPTLMNGTPVPVIMTATVNFRLD
ncbi:MAG: TonB family protein [Vicinamibacterales bacterium]